MPDTYAGATIDWNPIVGPEAFVHLDATSFTDAVEAASAMSARVRRTRDQSLALAVMQAGDGAYYATALAARTGAGAVLLSIDFDPRSRIRDVAAAHPDVRAVVGERSWVNLSGEAIDPKLAGT